MVRRPALDGLRALAVLAVMAFHATPAAPGGSLGVYVFVVISGYLITALLLSELARTGAVDLHRFSLRRALRLGPALLVMLAVAIPVMIIIERDTLGMPVRVDVGSVLLLVANWADAVIPGVLLAIALDRRSADWRLRLRHPQPRRPDLPPGVPEWSQPAAVAGLGGVLVLILTQDGGAGATYGLLLLAVACVPVVHHLAIAPSGGLVRVLSVRPLVWIGTVSYGLYLFHFPVFAAVQELQPGRYSHAVKHLLEFGLTGTLALVSWWLVERPALRLTARIRAPRPRGVVRAGIL